MGEHYHKGNVTHVSRVNIEAKARKTIETFTIENTCDLAPLPVEVQVSGLYILLLKTNKIMDQTMLENPKETLTLFMRMEIKGTLGNTLVFAFGKW
jgi:hypothetical protein